jgi:allantoin racemase
MPTTTDTSAVKIWHQSFTDLTTMPLYARTIDAHARRIMTPGTTVVPHGLRPGTYADGVAPIDAIKYRYLEALNEQQVCEAALTAEREGFDAVAIGCFFDPALRALRSLVEIPVVSLAESCMLTACSIGRAFGLVTLCVDEVDHLRDVAGSYGLAARLASVVGLTPGIDEHDLEGSDAEAGPILQNAERACRQVIEAGADVIIPGDGVLNEFLVRHQVTEVDGVPVLDSLGVLFHHAEMLAKLHRSTGLTASRRQYYAKPPQDMLKVARAFAGAQDMTSADFSTVPVDPPAVGASS